LINDGLRIALIAALPISELRGAIPIALTIYKMPAFLAYIFAVLGNIVPAIFLLLFLKPFSEYLRQWRYFDIFFKWLFTRTRRNTEEKFEKYGAIFLLFFVAIPLPVTGAWTGSAAFSRCIYLWHKILVCLPYNSGRDYDSRGNCYFSQFGNY